ncbi:hypothetical protein niasHT_013496 [Heterodera trifolii]|uniref:Uncharacterized protein n=1 Tax=Heterodera trifolii TaxID=157864 RepID=A0ABD2LCU7_9BILA
MPHVIEHKIRLLGSPSSPRRSPRPSEFGRHVELQKDKSWAEMPFERNDANEKQQQKRRRSTFSGGEETFGVESFERNLRYSPHEVDRQLFSVRTFEEKIPLGARENERSGGVRFIGQHEQTQENASDHGENNHFLLRRSPHLDTTPIRIPRVRISPSIERELGTGWAENGAEWRHSRVPPSPGDSCHSSGGWPSSPSPSPHCLSAAGDTPLQNVPMKKVIRRSRLVSIHDGRPMGPFTETIHYEPSTNASYYSSADEGKRRASGRRRRTTTSSDRRRDKVSDGAAALWTSSSSCSLCSDDEERAETKGRTKNKREGERGGRGGEGGGGDGRERGDGSGAAEWTRKGLVQVHHNPLFQQDGARHF